MSTQSIFRPTILAIALAAAFPAASAWADDEISELTSPNTAEAAINLPYTDKINPLYRQYDGVNNAGINANADLDYVRRKDAEWFRINARNLGLRTQEMGISYEKQGDWAISLDYDQIPRYSPYQVSTAVSGVGSTRIVQPNIANTAAAANNANLYDVTLKTEREITTLAASKFLMPGLKLGFTVKNEDKTGTRLSGVRGVTGTGATPANIYSAFLFAPEPINQNHKQLEATVEYTTEKYQLVAGYYGSFLGTKQNALTVVPGTNTALVAANLSPIALAPDNSVQQFYVTGAYNFSKDTRANLKVAWSEGRQDDAFLVGQPTLAGIGGNLNAIGAQTRQTTATNVNFSDAQGGDCGPQADDGATAPTGGSSDVDRRRVPAGRHVVIGGAHVASFGPGGVSDWTDPAPEGQNGAAARVSARRDGRADDCDGLENR